MEISENIQKTQREKMLTKSLELLKLWPHPICGYIYDYIWLVLGSRNNSMPSAPAGGMIPVCRSCEVPISPGFSQLHCRDTLLGLDMTWAQTQVFFWPGRTACWACCENTLASFSVRHDKTPRFLRKLWGNMENTNLLMVETRWDHNCP